MFIDPQSQGKQYNIVNGTFDDARRSPKKHQINLQVSKPPQCNPIVTIANLRSVTPNIVRVRD